MSKQKDIERLARFKPCSACKTMFEPKPWQWRTRMYKCGPCRTKESSEYARKNPDWKRRHNRAYQSKHSDDRAGQTRRYRANHPEKHRAHLAIRNAMRTGVLRKMPCSVCGNPKAIAHHEDYSRHLDIVWLCHDHHMKRHQGTPLAALAYLDAMEKK